MSPRRNYPKGKRPQSDEREIPTSNQSFEEHDDGLYIVRRCRRVVYRRYMNGHGCYVGINCAIARLEGDAARCRVWCV